MSALFDAAARLGDCREIAERKVRPLKKAGSAWRGVCPLRNCGLKSKQAPFAVVNGRARWRCYSCDERGGDAVDLEHRLFSAAGETMADAARRIVGGEARQDSDEERARRAQREAEAEREAMQSAAWKAELAAQLWREAVPSAGTPVQAYLEHRGLYGPVVARMLGQLRYHPRAYHSGHPERGIFLPAQIGLVTTELGPTGGVHATYLRANGKGKTHRDPAKRMWGPQGHRLLARAGGRVGPPDPRAEGDQVVVRMPGGIWLTRPDAAGPLVVAEGVENAGARAIMMSGDLSLPVRAVAAGSLDRLQGREILDDQGARDVWSPIGDPARPPFTWPENPECPWGVIDVATDGDMKPVDVVGRTGRGKVQAFTREPAERARVCGVLAVDGWRRRLVAGSATAVRASRPPAGRDFNDELRAAAAAGKESGAAA